MIALPLDDFLIFQNFPKIFGFCPINSNMFHCGTSNLDFREIPRRTSRTRWKQRWCQTLKALTCLPKDKEIYGLVYYKSVIVNWLIFISVFGWGQRQMWNSALNGGGRETDAKQSATKSYLVHLLLSMILDKFHSKGMVDAWTLFPFFWRKDHCSTPNGGGGTTGSQRSITLWPQWMHLQQRFRFPNRPSNNGSLYKSSRKWNICPPPWTEAKKNHLLCKAFPFMKSDNSYSSKRGPKDQTTWQQRTAKNGFHLCTYLHLLQLCLF